MTKTERAELLGKLEELTGDQISIVVREGATGIVKHLETSDGEPVCGGMRSAQLETFTRGMIKGLEMAAKGKGEA